MFGYNYKITKNGAFLLFFIYQTILFVLIFVQFEQIFQISENLPSVLSLSEKKQLQNVEKNFIMVAIKRSLSALTY